jgi:O-antigen ligase
VTRRSKSNHRPSCEPAARDRLRALVLGGTVALFAARPLAPTEAVTAATGDGLPFVMLTLLLVCLWWLGAWRTPRGARWGWVDLAWLALIGWQALSTWAATSHNAARPAINVFWEWAGMWLGFVLLRQVLAEAREARALIVVMVAVTVLLSLDGLFQYGYSAPAARAEYRRDPDQALRDARIDAPPGSPERMLFEDRLNSTEPTATFSLANSLAGVLTAWLVCFVGAGWLVAGRGPPSEAPRRNGALVLGLLVLAFVSIAACLILTKSRSAYLATIIGMAMVVGGGVIARRGRRAGAAGSPVRQRWLLAGATGGLLLLIMAAIGAGALDRQVLTEATKSLGYRWQFWQGAWGIIGDHPWLGCGLGNFQDHYTAYKLPEASEVVAEPHNWLLEVWATCGTPAAVALVGLFAAALADILRAARQSVRLPGLARSVAEPGAENRPQPVADSVLPPGADGVYAIIAGAMAALPLAYFVSLTATVPMPAFLVPLGLVVVLAGALAAQAWIDHGHLPAWVPLAACLALLVNLSAAGGIGYSGVAGSLWVLLALATSLASGYPRHLLRRPTAVLLLVASVLLSLVCYKTSYQPVLRCREAMAAAENEPARAVKMLRAAAAADPLSDEPWRRLADVLLIRWQQRRGQQALDDWEAAEREIIARRPNSSAVLQRAGERYLKVFHATGDTQYLTRATEAFQRAARLYPNQALVHARLALSLSEADQHVEAVRQAAEALRLHEITPHSDQKLSEGLAKRMREIASRNK